MTTPPIDELRAQWLNPGDIFSLLLLVGPDVVQKAIAQLVGVHRRVPWTDKHIYVTPIGFSFGWVAYAFTSLSAIMGDRRLMPAPDTNVQVINCENGYIRTSNSWVLGRLLRDHETKVDDFQRTQDPPKKSTGEVSLLVEIFVAKPVGENGPSLSPTWWLSWIVIITQLIIAAIPWIVWGYWPPFLITVTGTLLAILTAAMPQWATEKWSNARITKEQKHKYIALTRGNGHLYVILVLSHVGAWDFEAMASHRLNKRLFTEYLLTVFAALWVVLLLTVTGVKQYTWFLVVIGALGSIWQIYLSAKHTRPADFDIDLEPWDSRPTIVGYRYDKFAKLDLKKGAWKNYDESSAKHEYEEKQADPNVRDVMGTLIELEKFIPKAGAALLSVFFPEGINYESSALFSEREKNFWKYAKGQKSANKFELEPIQSM